MELISIEDQKLILLEILVSIHKYCEENRLTYYLDCGSLLGCIRHQGMIPWDDDVDIIMPRKDYEKLVSSFKVDGLTLFHYKKQKGYYYQYAKVSKDGTKIVEFSVPPVEGLGINIDVFVMDGMPNNIICRRIHQDVLMFLSKYRALMIRLRRKIPPLACLFRWRWTVAILNALGRLYSPDRTNYCGNITATTIRHKEVPSQCFRESVLKPFCGHYFSVPVGYHEYLTRLYGDYMTIPSKEKQTSQHHYEAFREDL